ncbi:MAG: tRNA (adenosine(37)-N6)-dimethylallyltransferase MiaA [Ignavibacteria bacterium]|nr:tRNA (adenosine(37)-N6)-dimethylallyltransferase MiaA [Ignavibacteria bacterium]
MVEKIFENFIENKTVPAIIGPTGIGKTNLALQLSEYLPLEVISADSRQIYRYLDIGTAKPTPMERDKVRHHFVDILDPDEYYSAGRFGKDSEEKISEIFEQNKIPLVVGGSGLYIKALFEGFFDESYTEDEKTKALKIRKELLLLDRDTLYKKLLEVDKETASIYPDKNISRLIRALEFYFVKGIPISLYRKFFHRKPKFKPLYIGLITDRERLYWLINQRVEKMWSLGLVEEVRRILDMGYSPSLNSLNTVGYKETIDYIFNKISELFAIEQIKKNTRNYAKRQITWFRKVLNIKWFNIENRNLINQVLNYLNSHIEMSCSKNKVEK